MNLSVLAQVTHKLNINFSVSPEIKINKVVSKEEEKTNGIQKRVHNSVNQNIVC